MRVVDLVFSEDVPNEYAAMAWVTELPGGFVWVGLVVFPANPPGRVKNGLARNRDEAVKQATDWCREQIRAGRV